MASGPAPRPPDDLPGAVEPRGRRRLREYLRLRAQPAEGQVA